MKDIVAIATIIALVLMNEKLSLLLSHLLAKF